MKFLLFFTLFFNILLADSRYDDQQEENVIYENINETNKTVKELHSLLQSLEKKITNLKVDIDILQNRFFLHTQKDKGGFPAYVPEFPPYLGDE